MSLEVNTIEFAQDTEERRRWFRAASFSHPAKMVLGLQIYLIEHYTKVGETILDPMGGSGTVLVGCALGRNVVCVELEPKFIKMIKANWEKIRSLGPMLGYKMGEATILQGDSRNLPELLVDKCVFSPPFADSEHNYKHGLKTLGKNFKGRKAWESKGKVDKIITSPPYAIEKTSGGLNTKEGKNGQQARRNPNSPSQAGAKERYGQSNGQIASLPYGEISAVISSPPFGEAHDKNIGGVADKNRADLTDCSYLKTGTKGQIGDMPYADAVITSPPYEGSLARDRSEDKSYNAKREKKHAGGAVNIEKGYQTNELDESVKRLRNHGRTDSGAGGPYGQSLAHPYSGAAENIGNLKSENYLQAMAQVYCQCHRVLKDGGLLCLVTKNFIREKKVVRLDTDTIKLCEKVGFVLKERLRRKLTSQSFWRIIYAQRFPDAPKIEFEDVLIFAKARPERTF